MLDDQTYCASAVSISRAPGTRCYAFRTPFLTLDSSPHPTILSARTRRNTNIIHVPLRCLWMRRVSRPSARRESLDVPTFAKPELTPRPALQQQMVATGAQQPVPSSAVLPSAELDAARTTEQGGARRPHTAERTRFVPRVCNVTASGTSDLGRRPASKPTEGRVRVNIAPRRPRRNRRHDVEPPVARSADLAGSACV